MTQKKQAAHLFFENAHKIFVCVVTAFLCNLMNGFCMISKPSAGVLEAQGIDIVFRVLVKMLSH